MKSFFFRARRALAFVSLAVFLTCQSASADFHYSYRDRYQNSDLMPISRGTLTAADIDFGTSGPSNLDFVRKVQAAYQTAMNQKTLQRSTLMATSMSFGGAVAGGVMAAAQSALLGDNKITRAEMINIFSLVKNDGIVSSQEFSELQGVLSNPSVYPIVDYVAHLAKKLVFGNPWNATYLGQALGNLAANATADHMTKLVDKWFFGKDHPEARNYWTGSLYPYANAVGKLYVNGVSYLDITQGGLGDCWFLAALSEVALREKTSIQAMIIDNLDNTFTIRYFWNGVADYTTVDRMLPVDQYGRLAYAQAGLYASNTNGELWVALVEKGLVQSYAAQGYTNTYSLLNGNYIGVGFSFISPRTIAIGNAMNYTNITNAWKKNAFIGLASKVTPSSTSIVSNHAYVMLGYNALSRVFSLYNPHGLNSATSAVFTMSWTTMLANFSYFDTAIK